MWTFVIKRLLATLPTVFVVSLFVFGLLYFAPGDPASILAGDHASVDDVARLRVQLGLDRPFLVQFAMWWAAVAQGDLGTSIFSSRPVTELILARVEPTTLLMLLTLAISIAIGIPAGVAAAWYRNTWVDWVVSLGSVLGFSMAVFVVGYLLAYVFSTTLGWLPVQGYVPLAEDPWQTLRCLILPSLALSGGYIALIARVTRASVLEVLRQDYIRTARAKGLSRSRLLVLHALKNAAVPIVTVIGLGVALLIGGAVVTETVFALPGLGRLIVESVLRRDYPMIRGIVLVFSLSYVFVNLAVDLVYTIVDPRIRY